MTDRNTEAVRLRRLSLQDLLKEAANAAHSESSLRSELERRAAEETDDVKPPRCYIHDQLLTCWECESGR